MTWSPPTSLVHKNVDTALLVQYCQDREVSATAAIVAAVAAATSTTTVTTGTASSTDGTSSASSSFSWSSSPYLLQLMQVYLVHMAALLQLGDYAEARHLYRRVATGAATGEATVATATAAATAAALAEERAVLPAQPFSSSSLSSSGHDDPTPTSSSLGGHGMSAPLIDRLKAAVLVALHPYYLVACSALCGDIVGTFDALSILSSSVQQHHGADPIPPHDPTTSTTTTPPPLLLPTSVLQTYAHEITQSYRRHCLRPWLVRCSSQIAPAAAGTMAAVASSSTLSSRPNYQCPIPDWYATALRFHHVQEMHDWFQQELMARRSRRDGTGGLVASSLLSDHHHHHFADIPPMTTATTTTKTTSSPRTIHKSTTSSAVATMVSFLEQQPALSFSTTPWTATI